MQKQLQDLAFKIDTAIENREIEVLKLLSNQCDEMLGNVKGKEKIILLFYKANCYSAFSDFDINSPDDVWSWSHGNRVSEILSLRKALSNDKFSELEPVFQCKILTNLGNSLSQFGRFIAAIENWNYALSILPNFAMALGNRGVCLQDYARSLYDYGHEGVLMAHSAEDLRKVVSGKMLWDSGSHPEVEQNFQNKYVFAETYLKEVNYDFGFDLNKWSVGNDEKEVKYKAWCLSKNLFLSPLNDICQKSVSAQDVLHLPNHTYMIDEDATFPKYYNIMKQEYVTARFMFFESFDNYEEHVADKDVLLMDGFDEVRFGYRNEQLKTAYRLAYSIFDKIALFLNEYYKIGLRPSAVSFRKIWGTAKKQKFDIHPCFEGNQNWPLRGLFYLSKDLFDDSFVDVALPEAKKISELRNRIEHRYLSLQEYDFFSEDNEIHSYISHADLSAKTLKVMSMVREALIYLSLAMHQEEKMREEKNEKSTVSIKSIPIKRFF